MPVCTCMCVHIWMHITLDGNPPPNRMEAERRMFPAGMFLMKGWLSHSRMWLQLLQVCFKWINVPMTFLTKVPLSTFFTFVKQFHQSIFKDDVFFWLMYRDRYFWSIKCWLLFTFTWVICFDLLFCLCGLLVWGVSWWICFYLCFCFGFSIRCTTADIERFQRWCRDETTLNSTVITQDILCLHTCEVLIRLL